MLGTMIEIKCDLFIEQVYDISWHAMSNVEQKMLNFMLTKSQRTQKLSCVGMVPLNMNLFLAVRAISQGFLENEIDLCSFLLLGVQENLFDFHDATKLISILLRNNEKNSR